MSSTRTFFGLIALVLVLPSIAQNQDLINFSDLKFQTSYEQRLFEEVGSNKFDPFDLLMVMPGVDSVQIDKWQKKYTQKVDLLKSQKRPKNDSKYVKNVYQFVHDQFLRKYENVSYFDQLFSNGVYNCVTAVGLYGLVFDEVGIPYEIKETTTHVYIVAYPGTSQQIGIETTDPIGGYKAFSPGFKQSFVDQLVRVKLIDTSELSMGIDAVFSKYYFTDTHLGIKELAGLQYYNKGLTHLDEQHYLDSYEQFKKAFFLHPTESIKDILIASAVLATSKLEYDKLEDVELLVFIANLEHGDIGKKEVLGEFGRVLEAQLAEKNDTVLLAKSHQLLLTGIKDSATIAEIDFYYNYERARRLYNTGNYDQSFTFSREALSLQPEHVEAQTLVVGAFNNALASDVWESDQYVDIVEGLYNQFPQLGTNKHLGALRAEIYLEAMYQSYIDKAISNAEVYQTKFEEFMESQDGLRVNEWSISRAYSQGITYHFKKGRYSSARKILNSGLKYSPENRELKMRKYYLDQAQF